MEFLTFNLSKNQHPLTVNSNNLDLAKCLDETSISDHSFSQLKNYDLPLFNFATEQRTRQKTNRLGGHAKVSMTSGLTSFIHVRWHNSSGICPGQPFVVEDFSAVVDSTLVDDWAIGVVFETSDVVKSFCKEDGELRPSVWAKMVAPVVFSKGNSEVAVVMFSLASVVGSWEVVSVRSSVLDDVTGYVVMDVVVIVLRIVVVVLVIGDAIKLSDWTDCKISSESEGTVFCNGKICGQ